MNINPMDLMKNLAQMQGQMKDVQEKLKDVKAEGAAGGDLVKVVINGKMEIENIKIDPIAVDPRDVTMLEDLILSAIEGATESIKEKLQKEVSSDTISQMFSGLGQ
ncbi:MAG: YbaB/EbfC family nucleoid-associated protein [Spirochaetales bacterium]|nr:YbaB/EbfC family nucleoid-associated protein [Spirochaetales bacterium]